MSSRDCNDCSNLLRRDGTSQNQRLFEEQKTDYVLVDERSYIDLIQFALKYSEKIQFWDVLNRRAGDWTSFMRNDQASIYTKIANTNIEALLEAFDLHYLVNFDDTSAPVETIEMMERTFEIAQLLDGWLAELDDDLTFTTELKNIVQRQANPIINVLKAYDYGAETKLDAAPTPDATLSSINYDSLSDVWLIETTEEDKNDNIFLIDPAINPMPTIADYGTEAKRYFRVLFKSMLDVLTSMKQTAEEQFNELLTDYSKHEPHFALFLTFIQLFKYAQDHLNQFTEKHLDFYYRDVLRLEEKAAIPDSVHLVFEPAKNIDQKKVEEGTPMKAGKDEAGVDITFETEDEIVVNKGIVSDLKSIYLDRDHDLKYIQSIYKADKANSQDGFGKEFTSENSAWEAFGKTQIKDGILIPDRTMRFARVGFGVASPELRMQEGERSIKLSFDIYGPRFDQVFGSDSSPDKGSFEEFIEVNGIEFDVPPEDENGTPLTGYDLKYAIYGDLLSQWMLFRLSGENGWVIPDNIANEDKKGVPKVTITKSVTNNVTQNVMIVELWLSREQDPIVPYNADIHSNNYTTQWPILEVLCDQTPKIGNIAIPKMAYEFMKDLRFFTVRFECNVKGMMGLNLANDNGDLDSGKPHFPFTNQPKVGSNFYIGSQEVFSKRLTNLSVTIDWKGVPDAKLDDYYKLYRKSNSGLTSETQAYPIGDAVPIVEDNSHFTAHIKLLDNFGWRALSKEASSANYRELHQSSSLVLKQVSSIFVAPLFLLIALWEYMFGHNEEITAAGSSSGSYLPDAMNQPKLELDLSEPVQRDPKTSNFVNLFRYSTSTNADSNDARLPHTITVEKETTKTNFDLLGDNYTRDPFLGELGEYSEGTKRGYMKLELVNDFFHDAYSRVLSARMRQFFGASGLPNKPYTPEIQKTVLDYTSVFKITYNKNSVTLPPVTWENRVEQFFHISPFGEVEVFPGGPEKNLDAESEEIYYSNNFFPQLFKQTENEITEDGLFEEKVDPFTGRNVTVNLEETSEGQLFIGIEDFVPPQSLSLLFQFKEGTEDNDLEVPAVEWSYLSMNQWVSFESTEIIDDATNGLVNSGIVKFSVPAEATNENVLYGEGKHWIRAAISGNTEAFSDLISVHAQAVKATYAENENDPYRLKTEIESGTISKQVNKDFEIKKIEQPYASFGGRIKEQKTEFYTRVAERLRHKQRGITIRDYEHLVLQEFPEIYKTKCINHTSKHSEYAPGNVSIIVIPYFKNQNERNPFELKVSKAKLSSIRRFLTKLNSPFVKLDVRNPKYEAIQVKFGVEFHLGYDRTFYKNQLNDEIREFISPWAFGKEEDIIFGGKINRSTILNFIEERPYVDYVTNFEMFHKQDENRAQISVFVAEGTTASSVLVTALSHEIEDVNCSAS